MRVYLPATLATVRQWHHSGGTPLGRTAYAVTAAIREWYAEGDDEELEWAAQTMAARGSLRLLAAEVLERDVRRVVIAADVAEQDLVVLDESGNPGHAAQAERGSVRLGAAIPVRSWAAVLIDEPRNSSVIAAAAGAIALAEGGDEDAAFTVSEADDVELLWFAVEELGSLS